MRMNEGDIQRVVGTAMVVREVRSIDNVDYELYGAVRGEDSKYGGGIRVLDVDSDKVVMVVACATFAAALAKFNDATAILTEAE